MANKRVNVLVYSGNGATVESVRHALYTLRRLLSPNYAVIPIDGDAVVKEPWSSTCALFVMPGGADLPYCRKLNGEGNRKISQYVNRGGAYLGLCAGAYYASKRCEFMLGDPRMEVAGDRELSFFPDVCRGLAFPGFVYQSEAGARAAELRVNREAFATEGVNVPESFRTYYNGGGVFVNANRYKDRHVEVLAEYTEDLNVDPGDSLAAVVYCKVGEGSVVLTAPHPEFAAVNLNKDSNGPTYGELVGLLEQDDKLRTSFFKACLLKLSLQVNAAEQDVPSLSRLHLSSAKSSSTSELAITWSGLISPQNGGQVIKGANDTFFIEKSLAKTMATLELDVTPAEEQDHHSDGLVLDYDKVTKRMFIHEEAMPTPKETPFFNHAAYFSNLQEYTAKSGIEKPEFGKFLLYGEVVTSTSTMLEKNPSLLHTLPTGFTATATTQIAGRGRGHNVWVSPPGSLMFSTVIKHPMALTQKSPVIFLQYLAALAIVEGVRTYAPGYAKVPIKLKWPNDIYALDPQGGSSREGRDAYVKIGGILVNSSYSGSDYEVVVGIGINVANAAPTTGLNVLARRNGLEAFQQEKLLARILTCFEGVYRRFCREGWSRELEGLYYSSWLHSDQIVTLEAEGGTRAKIKGITRDWGLLLAEELGWEDRPTGKVWQLQSDSNSFDFFKGLVKRKV